MTEAALSALENLRSTDHLSWYVIPLLTFVIYVYAAEVHKKNWHIVLTGLLFFLGEFAWEMFNALVLHLSGFSALWVTPGRSAYIVLAGLNVEIMSMFAVAGVILAKSLPEDEKLKIAGIPNRILIPLLWGLFCVFVEVLLNQAGMLIWDYWWWSWPHVYLIVFVYVAPFFLVRWIYDRLSLKTKTRGVYVLLAVDVAAWVLFVNILHWI